MFQKDGGRIFNARSLGRKWLGPWVQAKHAADGLRHVIAEQFGDRIVGDLNHRILIPAVNFSKGTGQFFKTPHAPQFFADYKHKLVDVGLATAAAPTYFPMHKLGEEGVFVDGGLVGNSPGFFGMHEAHHVLGVPRGPGNIRVLAVGTMSRGATKRGDSGLDWGVKQWGTKIFDLVISAQEYSVNVMLEHLLGADYLRIDDPATPEQSQDITALDVYSPAAIEVLTSRGTQAARRDMGDSRFVPFREHIAQAPTFFHGPNKNSEVD